LDNDFGEKLKNILSDPEAMAKITAIASSLGAGEKSEERQETPQTKDVLSENITADSLGAMLNPITFQDPRIQLLTAMKPLLREEKRGRVDSLVRALSIASLMKNFRK